MLEVVFNVFVIRSYSHAFLLFIWSFSLLLLLRIALLLEVLLFFSLRLRFFFLFTLGYFRPLLVSKLLPLRHFPIVFPLAVLFVGHVWRLRLFNRLLFNNGLLSLVMSAAIERPLILPLLLDLTFFVSSWLQVVTLSLRVVFIVVALFHMGLSVVSMVMPLVRLPLGVRIRVFIRLLVFLVRMQLIVAAPITLSLAIAAGEFNFRLVGHNRLVMICNRRPTVIIMLGLVNQRCVVVVLLVPVIMVARTDIVVAVRNLMIDG